MAAIEHYEKLFFDVKDHLAARDWIVLHALRWQATSPAGQIDLGAVWRAFGYFGGPVVLEALSAATLHEPLPDWTRRPWGEPAVMRDIRLRLASLLAVAITTAQSDREMLELVRLSRQRYRLERRLGGAPPGSEDRWWDVQVQFYSMIVKGQRAMPPNGMSVPSDCQSQAAGQPRARPGAGGGEGEAGGRYPAADGVPYPLGHQAAPAPKEFAGTLTTPSRRSLAGRLNRQKRKGLTPEGRHQLRLAALQNQPWRHATGPRTLEGKAKVARNGKVRQRGPHSVREIRTRLAPLRSLLLLLRAGRRLVGGPLRDEEWHDLSEHVAATLKELRLGAPAREAKGSGG